MMKNTKNSISVKDSAYFVTAHTFCASRDTRISYGWCLQTGIFWRGLKLCGESRTYQVLLVSKKKIGGNHAFSRGNKASIWKKRHTLLRSAFLALS